MKKTTRSKSSPASAKIKILIVDDHPLVRDWLGRLIGQESDLIACGEAADRAGAIASLDARKPDMVVTDLSLGDGALGIELIKDIRARTPSLPVLVLSMHDESIYAERALHAGATGYVSKQAAPAAILDAIRRVARGEIFLSGPMAAKVLKKFATGAATHAEGDVERLSDRELEVFELLGHGKSSQEIGDQLHISIKTVETYKTRLKDKLGLGNARELLQHAVQWLLVHGS